MHAVLTFPVAGLPGEKIDQYTQDTAVEFPVRVRRATLVANDHNHADELKLSTEWKDSGIDPRMTSNVNVAFWMGDADERGVFVPAEKNFRFSGIGVVTSRTMGSGGLEVEMEFQDYTTLFINQKPFYEAGLPWFDQTLAEAWRTICDYTGPRNADKQVVSLVKNLRDNLIGHPAGIENTIIGKAVSERFRKRTKVHAKPGADAWAVWQQCVGMCGLISFIRGGQCIVTTATDLYTGDNPPRFIWGQNILSMNESRNMRAVKRAVGLVSFDPMTGTTIEAVYPPYGADEVKKKHLRPLGTAKKAPTEEAIRNNDDREWFEYPEVTDPEVLLEIAKRAYEERSRQESEGKIETVEMRVDTLGGTETDVLEIRHGDVIRVEFDRDIRDSLAALGTVGIRREYLLDRGYTDVVATVIARNIGDFLALEPNFYVKSVTSELSNEEGGGTFKVEIHYVNRIQVDGAAIQHRGPGNG